MAKIGPIEILGEGRLAKAIVRELQKALLDAPPPPTAAPQHQLFLACSDDPALHFRTGPVYLRPPEAPARAIWVMRTSLLAGHSLVLSPPRPVAPAYLAASLDELDSSLQTICELQFSKRAG